MLTPWRSAMLRRALSARLHQPGRSLEAEVHTVAQPVRQLRISTPRPPGHDQRVKNGRPDGLKLIELALFVQKFLSTGLPGRDH
jgi:hypothetical protein